MIRLIIILILAGIVWFGWQAYQAGTFSTAGIENAASNQLNQTENAAKSEVNNVQAEVSSEVTATKNTIQRDLQNAK